MVFACQSDSFKKIFSSTVKSCEKNENDDGYEIICEDTILFPEGGGQPWDTGFLNNVRVYQVLRRGPEAIHFAKEAIPVGTIVEQRIDWDRRLDHMQQHSGQHLITAVINAEYKIDTTAWWLGTDVSHIELDTTKLTQEQLDLIEKQTNEKIMEQVPVTVKLYDINDPSLNSAHTRGLPDDVAGPIRVVDISGMEDNMCCGTHVTNLIQLQVIKLLYAEKGKKNKTNLFFIAGGRVLKHLSKALVREQKMTQILNNEPSQHIELVEKLLANGKAANKKLSNTLKLLAAFEARTLLQLNPRPQYYVHQNKDGDQEYAEAFLRTLRGDAEIERTLVVLTVGDDKGAGNLIIQGEAELVEDIGPKLADFLGGKGAAHRQKFQAKVTKMGNFKKALNVLKETFEKIPKLEQ